MGLPDGVHELTVQVAGDGYQMEIHPLVVETEYGALLLDVGTRGTVDQLEQGLRDSGLGFDDVHVIVATHQDADHVDGLRDVVGRTDALVAAHQDDALAIAGESHPIKGDDDRYPPVPVDIELVDGVTFRTDAGPMQVVATPGHTPGHVSCYFPDGSFLAAADALTNEDGLGGPDPAFTPQMDEAIRSIDRLAELDVTTVCCYHGGTLSASGDDIASVYDSLRTDAQ